MESDLVRSQYSLSIRFVPDGFSLYVFDENNQLILQKREETEDFYTSDLENTLNIHHEIHNNYRHISIYVESSVYTLIPAQFDNHDSNRSMIQLQFPALDKNAQIANQLFKNQGFSLLWIIPQKLKTAVQNIFTDTPLQHHLTDILNNQEDSGDHVFIWQRSTDADFIISRKKKILLCNSIATKAPEDLVYHTLNFLKQLEFDIEQCTVNLFHDKKGTESYELLRKFLPKINGITKESVYENYQR
jgi:hypothetical protein